MTSAATLPPPPATDGAAADAGGGLLAQVAARLAAAGVADSAEEAAALVGQAGGDPAALEALVARRVAGEPLGLVLGRATFLGVPLLVPPGTLAPRPETELLAQTAVAALRRADLAAPRVLDLCCGVGNLAAAIATHVPSARVWAADLTGPCVDAARCNVARLGLGDRVTVAQGDLFAPLAGAGLEGTVDLIVCNPPYISTGRLARDRARLLAFEPREAFDAGPYGLAIHHRVIAGALAFLRPGGWLMVECGAGQGAQVQALFRRARGYDDIRLVHDASGTERVVVGRSRPGDAP